MSSSLLKTKNSTKLVKRFLQRTSDWHTNTATNTASCGHPNSDEDAATARRNKKRQRQLEAQAVADATPAVNQEEIVERHVQTMLSVDATMRQPPTKSMKKNKQLPHKKRKSPNMEVTLKRLVREDKQQSKQRKLVQKMLPAGSSRSSAAQSRTIHVRTFNKVDHAKQAKEQSLKRIAKLLKQREINQKVKRKLR